MRAARRKGFRYIREVGLFEVGPTLIGAHRWAKTLEVKALRGVGASGDDQDETWSEVVARARRWRADAWGVLRPVCEVCGSEDRVEDVRSRDGSTELCRWCRVAVRAIGGRPAVGVR